MTAYEVLSGSPYPDAITFEADGVEHEATVGLPCKRPGADYMVQEVGGIEYQILIDFRGGFVARPIAELRA